MQRETEEVLHALHNNDWFQNLSVSPPNGWIQIGSKSRMENAMTSLDRENLILDHLNAFRFEINDRDKARLKNWNDVVHWANDEAEKIFGRYSQQNALFTDGVLDLIKTDIRKILAASEFSDVVPLGFFRSLLEVYLAGHILCGWNGDYPDGVPVVY